MAIIFKTLDIIVIATVIPTKTIIGIKVTFEYEFYNIALRKMVVIHAMQQEQTTSKV